MLRFLYWAVRKSDGETINFIDENFFDIGEEVYINDKDGEVSILDLAVEDNVSCEELKMQMENMRYYV